jgi:hypothetical protein
MHSNARPLALATCTCGNGPACTRGEQQHQERLQPLLLRAAVRPAAADPAQGRGAARWPLGSLESVRLVPPRVICSFSRTRIPGSPSLRHCPRCRRPALARARGAANSGSLVLPVQIPVCVGNPDGGVQCGHGAHSSLTPSKLLEQA